MFAVAVSHPSPSSIDAIPDDDHESPVPSDVDAAERVPCLSENYRSDVCEHVDDQLQFALATPSAHPDSDDDVSTATVSESFESSSAATSRKNDSSVRHPFEAKAGRPKTQQGVIRQTVAPSCAPSADNRDCPVQPLPPTNFHSDSPGNEVKKWTLVRHYGRKTGSLWWRDPRTATVAPPAKTESTKKTLRGRNRAESVVLLEMVRVGRFVQIRSAVWRLRWFPLRRHHWKGQLEGPVDGADGLDGWRETGHCRRCRPDLDWGSCVWRLDRCPYPHHR
jgi:hypothetical protein